MVSIIVPIYNTEKYLSRCIDSLLNQTYTDLEIILVDDGSTDASGAICDAYSEKDKRVRVIHQPNSGESKARNAGLEAVSGEYTVFCDSDDEYKLDAVQVLRQTIEGCDLAIGAYLEVSADKTRYAGTGETPYCTQELVLRVLNDVIHYGTNYMMSCLHAKIYKSSIIKNYGLHFDEKWVVGNDGLFVLDYLRYCEKIVDTFIPMYVYYKYDVNERVQGMSWHYPDFYRLDIEMHKKYFALLNGQYTKERLSRAFSGFVGKIIRAYQYKNLYTNGFDKEIYWFVNDPFVRQCAECYIPTREYESRTISAFVLTRNYASVQKEVIEKSLLLTKSDYQFIRRIYNED